MSTPTAMKHASSQQGKTPSQSQHGAAATPPVSTPFYAAAFSPHGPKSSPQVKRSPATATSAATMNHPSNAPVNFDSPSAAAAFGSLPTLDLNLDGVNVGSLGLGSLGKSNEDERAKRLDEVVAILSSKGVVSEAGLERLAKRLGIESMWEEGMGVESKKTFIVAGSALELIITFSNNVVQSATLSFPDSTEIVNKHAAKASQMLFDDLKLAPGQIPLTKKMDKFAANFERLVVLDKQSINPGLNLFEAVCGVYESLARLHQWELQKLREDATLSGKPDEYLENLVLCTRSGRPVMSTRGGVGLSLDYWKEKRLQVLPPGSATTAAGAVEPEDDKTWALLISCAPLRDLSTAPVRVSDKWISPSVEKMHMPGELQHPGAMIDWLEPENTFIPHDDQGKSGSVEAAPAEQLLGQLPNVAFTATFDPPLHVSAHLAEQFRHLGLGLPTPDIQVATLDGLIIPFPPGAHHPLGEPRTVARTKTVEFIPPQGGSRNKMKKEFALRTHGNVLHIHRSIFGKTLREASFSHPQLLVQILPYLRQYAFLSTLLENSFGDRSDPPSVPGSKAVGIGTGTAKNKVNGNSNGLNGHAKAATTTTTTTTTATKTATGMKTTTRTITTRKTTTTTDAKTTTKLDELEAFLAQAETTNNHKNYYYNNIDFGDGDGDGDEAPHDLKIDVTLSVNPMPQLQIVFPFRDRMADVVLEIRENGQVHVEAQDVLDASNAVAPDGRQRRAEDLGRLLEVFENIGKWAEFIRTRWAY